MIYPKHGESVSAIDHFWGECSSKVIFLWGVEIKLVDFGGECGPISGKFGGRHNISSKKFQNVGR